MLNLLKSTQVNKILSKEKLIDKLNLSPALKVSLKDHIKRFIIANELSPKSMNIAKGETVSGIFVMEVLLKQKNIDYKLIESVAKQNTHKLLFVLSFEEEFQLAVFYGKLYRSEWVLENDLSLEIKGDNFDVVWDNIVKEIEGGDWNEELSAKENLSLHEQVEQFQKQIAALEKKARAEKQPKKKFELAQKIGELKRECDLTAEGYGKISHVQR